MIDYTTGLAALGVAATLAWALFWTWYLRRDEDREC